METFYKTKSKDPDAALKADELKATEEKKSMEDIWRAKLICIRGRRTKKEYFFIPLSEDEDGGREIFQDMVEDLEHPEDGEDDYDDGSLATMDRELQRYEDCYDGASTD